jgi:hypothetical protein
MIQINNKNPGHRQVALKSYFAAVSDIAEKLILHPSLVTVAVRSCYDNFFWGISRFAAQMPS